MHDFEIEDKYDELIELLEEVLGDSHTHYESKNQITFDCPLCSELKGVEHDHKGNLEVNYAMGIFNCWACSETHGTKGRIYKIFKDFGDRNSIAKFIKGKFQFTNEYDEYDDAERKEKKANFLLPPEFFPLNIANKKYPMMVPGYSYMYSRGISDEIMAKYNIGFCITGKYQDRIIIPSYDEFGDLNYFISRSILKKIKKKYDNPDIEKTSIIFNEQLINWDEPIYLVEGAFDHIVIPNSIPLLGKVLYEKLFALLYEKAKNLIIIVLDPDAAAGAEKIYNRLDAGKLYGRIRINKMPEDYDVSEFHQKFGIDLFKWLKEKTYKIVD